MLANVLKCSSASLRNTRSVQATFTMNLQQVRSFAKKKEAAVVDDGDEVFAQVLSRTDKNMDGAVLSLKKHFAGMRPGQADAGVFDSLKLEAYGQIVPIPQVAQVAVSSSTSLKVNVFDPSLLPEVEKSIKEANSCYNTSVDGSTVLVRFPKMTKEVRDDMIKTAKKQTESSRQQIRRVRQDAMNRIKKVENVSEDDKSRHEKEIQKKTDAAIDLVGKLLEDKQKDLSSV